LSVPLLNVQPVRWACPNCDVTDVTYPLPPGQSQYHVCSGLHGLNAPLVPEGIRAKVEATEREDYLNGDVQPVGDDGKAYMNVTVTREDGQDCTVFAPTAHADVRTSS
jgi:hypothetical protein